MERVLNPPLGGGGGLDGNSFAVRLMVRFRAIVQRLLHAPTATDAPLRLEARLNLGPKKSLFLVNCCGRRVLLAVSGDTIVPVAELPKPGRTKTPAGRGAAR